MRLVEGIRGEFLPISPDLLQNLRVVAVFLAALNEFRLHRVDNILLLLTHRLTQGITLTSGEISQLSGEQHHLLLIHGNTIGIFQVFFHAGDIVFNLFTAVLSGNERRDIVHRSWTIEGIHGDKVLKDGRMQFTQVFLHTVRLKLEGTDGTALLIEFVCLGIVNGDSVEIDLYAPRTLDVSTCLLQLRQRLQPQEVHLDKSRRFDDMTVVLRAVGLGALEIWVICRRDGYMVRYRVTADDKTTGMDTRSSHCSLQHLCILDGVGECLIGRGLRLL